MMPPTIRTMLSGMPKSGESECRRVKKKNINATAYMQARRAKSTRSWSSLRAAS